MTLPLTLDVLKELELVHETGHFSSDISLEEQWQQVIYNYHSKHLQNICVGIFCIVHLRAMTKYSSYSRFRIFMRWRLCWVQTNQEKCMFLRRETMDIIKVPIQYTVTHIF